MIDEELRDAMYCGYVDADMLGKNINTLNSITDQDGVLYLAGDKVSLVPRYKHIELMIGRFPITGSTKSELLMRLLECNQHAKVGEFMGWTKYLVQYKEHTLVVSIHERMYSSVKLLKDDAVAKKLYEASRRTPINEWRQIEMVSKQYGAMSIGIPHVVDDIIERIDVAIEFLESVMNDHEVARYVESRLQSLYTKDEEDL